MVSVQVILKQISFFHIKFDTRDLFLSISNLLSGMVITLLFNIIVWM